MKKYLFLFVAAAIWWLLFFRFGETPRFFRFFLWAESPLIIHVQPHQNQKFSNKTLGKIELDEWGIPRIISENENQSAYLLGWMHGQERRFQMEMIRRTVEGTLSEVVGKKALNSDIFWRRFQFSKKWRSWYAQQPEYLKVYLESYVEGVNDQWKQQKIQQKPLEFFLLDIEPEEFQSKDLYYLLRYMDFSLNYDESELALKAVKNQLPPEVFHAFYLNNPPSSYPILSQPISIENNSSASPQENSNQKLTFKKDWVLPSGKTEVGSNNWAIGKNGLLTGNAVLSNDPHLQLQLPNTWYEASIETNLGKKAGFTIPGSPFFISGNNDSIAWGITNATWTLTHFFPVKPSNKNSIILNGKVIPTKIELEEIEVRGNSTTYLEVQKCEWGIIDTLDGHLYLIQWVGNSPTQLSNESLTFWQLEHGKNLSDAEKALHWYGHPPQNFVIADHSGGIFQASCGFMGATNPQHPVNWKKGQLQLKEVNPSRGFVFSANQIQSSHPSIHQLSNSFAPQARAKGIHRALSQKKSTLRSILALQTEIKDEEWEEFQEKFLLNIPRDYQELKKEMKNWNGRMEESSVCASFFAVVRHFLQKELVRECLGEVGISPLSDRMNEILLKNEAIQGKNGMVRISKIWGRGMILGIDSLVRIRGRNWKNWTYGSVHTAQVTHLTKIGILGAGNWFLPGSTRSINVLRIGKSIHGASMRNTVFFTDSGFVRYSMNFGGQSGRFFSQNYHDQIQPWRDGLYRKQHFSKKPLYVYEFHP